MRRFLIFCSFIAGLACAAQASACDLCAIYRGEEAKVSRPGFNIGAFEQFTRFGTLQDGGKEVPNVAGQYLNSSITQFIAGYQWSGQFGLQVNLPYIYRSFRRPAGFLTDKGTVSGLGDMSLTGNYRLYENVTEDMIFIWSMSGGVKFPTGSSARIAEELNETPPPPGAPESGIHGHDLALGSGSYDGIVGTNAVLHYSRVFVSASVQYAIRGTGDFGYRHDNNLNWSLKPGAFLFVSDDATLGCQLAVTGESKGRDTFQGSRVDDTGITTVFLGPELSFTWKEELSAGLGADFPVLIDNTALQIVPDYKIRAALVWRL